MKPVFAEDVKTRCFHFLLQQLRFWSFLLTSVSWQSRFSQFPCESRALSSVPCGSTVWRSCRCCNESTILLCSVLCARSLMRVSVGQHPSVHRAAFFLEDPFPAFPGFCVVSFLGLGLTSSTTALLLTILPHLHFPLTGNGKGCPFLG